MNNIWGAHLFQLDGLTVWWICFTAVVWWTFISRGAQLSYNSEISSASHSLGQMRTHGFRLHSLRAKISSAATQGIEEEWLNCPRAGKRCPAQLLKANHRSLFTVEEDIVKFEFPTLKTQKWLAALFSTPSQVEKHYWNLYTRQEINYADEIKDERADPRCFTLDLAIMIKEKERLFFFYWKNGLSFGLLFFWQLLEKSFLLFRKFWRFIFSKTFSSTQSTNFFFPKNPKHRLERKAELCSGRRRTSGRWVGGKFTYPGVPGSRVNGALSSSGSLGCAFRARRWIPAWIPPGAEGSPVGPGKLRFPACPATGAPAYGSYQRRERVGRKCGVLVWMDQLAWCPTEPRRRRTVWGCGALEMRGLVEASRGSDKAPRHLSPPSPSLAEFGLPSDPKILGLMALALDSVKFRRGSYWPPSEGKDVPPRGSADKPQRHLFFTCYWRYRFPWGNHFDVNYFLWARHLFIFLRLLVSY